MCASVTETRVQACWSQEGRIPGGAEEMVPSRDAAAKELELSFWYNAYDGGFEKFP